MTNLVTDITVPYTASTSSMNVGVYKQCWKCYVKYYTNDDEHIEMPEFIMLAPKMDTVYRYLQRKFLRVAKKIEDIDVKDGGYTSRTDCLELVEWSDGAISARQAKDAKVISEEAAPNPNTLAAACEAILTAMGPSSTVIGYKTEAPKEPSPPLDTHAVFTKLQWPGPLHEQGNKFFKSKFYEVFPREK